MAGVDGYVSPGHVPAEYVHSDESDALYNQPHVDLHNNTSDALDTVAAAVPTGLADLTDDFDNSITPQDGWVPQYDLASGKYKPAALPTTSSGGDSGGSTPPSPVGAYQTLNVSYLPLFYYPLADFDAGAGTTGGTMTDYSANMRDGTYEGDVTPGVTDDAAQSTVEAIACQFNDGVSSGLGAGQGRVAHSSDLNLATTSSTAWALKLLYSDQDSTQVYKNILVKGNPDTTGWEVWVSNDGNVGVKIAGQQRSDAVSISNDGTFQHLSIIWDGSNLLFLKAGQVQATITDMPSATATTTADLLIGAGANVALDEVTLVDYAFTVTQMRTDWISFNGTPTAGGVNTLWEDDFDGSTLDTSVWTASRSGGDLDGAYNPDLENAYFATTQVSVASSNVVLKLEPHSTVTINGYTYDYVSGAIQTYGKMMLWRPGTFLHGYIKVPAGDGLWPAFWGASATRWPPECDIFEYFDTSSVTVPKFNYHYPDQSQTGPTAYGSGDLTGAYHKYGVWWDTDGSITPYLDEVEQTALAITGAATDPNGVIFNLSLYRGHSPTTPAYAYCDWMALLDGVPY